MSGWDQAAIANHYRRLKLPPEAMHGKPHGPECVCSECEAGRKPAPKATGRTPWTPKMNGTERAYDAFLRTQYAAGEILWWHFEPIMIRLGPDCHFKPDFMVLYADGHLELHDTKGTQRRKTGDKAYYSRDTGSIKARVTAMRFPIPIYFLFSTGDGGWGKKGFGE